MGAPPDIPPLYPRSCSALGQEDRKSFLCVGWLAESRWPLSIAEVVTASHGGWAMQVRHSSQGPAVLPMEGHGKGTGLGLREFELQFQARAWSWNLHVKQCLPAISLSHLHLSCHAPRGHACWECGQKQWAILSPQPGHSLSVPLQVLLGRVSTIQHTHTNTSLPLLTGQGREVSDQLFPLPSPLWVPPPKAWVLKDAFS